MSNLFINKKAQYYQPVPSYSSVSPILVIGIIIVCLPFMLPLFGITINDFFKSLLYGTGIITILIGGVFSIFKATN